jgi:hypothetical protein
MTIASVRQDRCEIKPAQRTLRGFFHSTQMARPMAEAHAGARIGVVVVLVITN